MSTCATLLVCTVHTNARQTGQPAQVHTMARQTGQPAQVHTHCNSDYKGVGGLKTLFFIAALCVPGEFGPNLFPHIRLLHL